MSTFAKKMTESNKPAVKVTTKEKLFTHQKCHLFHLHIKIIYFLHFHQFTYEIFFEKLTYLFQNICFIDLRCFVLNSLKYLLLVCTVVFVLFLFHVYSA